MRYTAVEISTQAYRATTVQQTINDTAQGRRLVAVVPMLQVPFGAVLAETSRVLLIFEETGE